MSRNRKKGFLAWLGLFPCIVIIASLHHISHNIVAIHLTLGNSQGRYVMRLRLSITPSDLRRRRKWGSVDAR